MTNRPNPHHDQQALETAEMIAALLHRKLQGALDAAGEAALAAWLNHSPKAVIKPIRK